MGSGPTSIEGVNGLDSQENPTVCVPNAVFCAETRSSVLSM